MAAQPLTYLIVEDSYYLSRDLQLQIEKIRSDLSPRVAEGGAEALDIINKDNIGLIITNTTVSDGSAIDFFSEKGVEIPMIIYSPFKPDSTSYNKLNVLEHLILPIRFEKLKNIILRYNS